MNESNFRAIVVGLLSVIAVVQVLAYVAPTSSASAGDPQDVRVVDWRVYGRAVKVEVVGGGE
jgi:hypothetical protein